jgi:hypothetical protein
MIIPQFPYKGNQIILTSDRVTLHSKKDGVFLFGKATVGLSSVGTINLDSKEKVLIDSPKIELGSKAEQFGEPVPLGASLQSVLYEINTVLSSFANAMAVANGVDDASTAISLTAIKVAGSTAISAITNIQAKIENILSQTTYTK